MPRKNTVILELKGTTSAGGLLTLRSGPLRTGETLCLQWAAFRSPLTAGAVAHLWAERNGVEYGICSTPMAAAATTYPEILLVWLPAEYNVRVDVTAGGNAVEFHAWLYGYIANLPD